MGAFVKLRNILSMPTIYVLFQRAVWGAAMRELVKHYIRPESGQRVLDIGCGPADILRLMPTVRYMGFDHDQRYIEAARRRFGSQAKFLLAAVGSVPPFDGTAHDVVLAKGVLHHVNDHDADRLFRLAHQALRPGGRLITVDGCYHAGQPRAHRKITSMDRGAYIRSPQQYRLLAESVFEQAIIDVRDDLLRIPYSLAIGVFTR